MSTATVEKPGEYTVQQAAEMFRKDRSHIRRLCASLGLGRVAYGRVRILYEEDLERLRLYFEEVGRDRGPVWYTIADVAEGLGESTAYIGRLASELNLGRLDGRNRMLATADVHVLSREVDSRRAD